ncbi:MAG: MoaD/ThiS family protein [Deltaproteobacteria bacterium]|nr:MoaD/ThiS family protein [Deltaproteobacteria bacterium]
MKVTVRLYGTLRKRFSGYRAEQGLEIFIPDEATARDLLDHLKIMESLGPVVAMEGRIMKPDDKIDQGADIRIFQTVHGG